MIGSLIRTLFLIFLVVVTVLSLSIYFVMDNGDNRMTVPVDIEDMDTIGCRFECKDIMESEVCMSAVPEYRVEKVGGVTVSTSCLCHLEDCMENGVFKRLIRWII